MLERQEQEKRAALSTDPFSVWNSNVSFRLNNVAKRKIRLDDGDRKVYIIISYNKDGTYNLEIEGRRMHAKGKLQSEGSRVSLTANVDGRVFKSWLVDLEGTIHIFTKDGCHKLRRPVPKFLRGGPSAVTQGSAIAPMTGTVVKVFVEPGQTVKEGETLVVMEAMKMEHVIRTPKSGVIEKVLYSAGQAVNRHAQLVQFQEQGEEPNSGDDDDEQGPEAE